MLAVFSQFLLYDDEDAINDYAVCSPVTYFLMYWMTFGHMGFVGSVIHAV